MGCTRKKFFKIMQTGAVILIGNALLAFQVAAFIIPHDIIMGGTTGIGIVLNKTLEIDAAVLILGLNILLLIFGLTVLGMKFFLTTVASSVLYPVMLAAMERIPKIGSITDNDLLAALAGGCLMGISVGMLMRVGSSTGGMDIVNLVLHKWFHLPVAVFVSVTDLIVVGGQALFAKPEQLFLGIIVIVCETLMIDRAMILGRSQVQVYAISNKYEELRQKLLKETNVGLTMILIETGLFGYPQKGILCVVSPRKLYDVIEAVQSIDPDAFITVTKIKEVRGQGFTRERYARDPNGEAEQMLGGLPTDISEKQSISDKNS